MTAKTDLKQNLLSKESSPYLLQHANNPVHWLAWNADSLLLAKQSDKPILLSVGYSACHWCHVMAHESFENQATADVMNDLFINIKVDKEERPDLDKIYQNAHSLLTEAPGGWPLTVFLTPDTHMPIFAGTYFPDHEKHGLPAFVSLLQQISDIWKTRKPDIQQQSNALKSTYQRIYQATKPDDYELTNTTVDIARNQIEKQFDSKNGGFSGSPKFPHPSILEFSLKYWMRTKSLNSPDPRILHCAIFTLEKMADGGLFDHLGGGFYRYSTDEQWMIPHFEKMLYDNGPLLSLYSNAYRINADLSFHDAACETAHWVIREMQSAEGGYYSAQDADSEGEEGKFFTWTSTELNSLLEQINTAQTGDNISRQTIELFRSRFGLDLPENFAGKRHLHGYEKENTLARKHQCDQNELHQQLNHIRQQLFLHRESRIHPQTDTKVLCAWNGLMIHGMATAGRLLDKAEFTNSAVKAAIFIKDHNWIDGQLFANFKDGKSTIKAYLDDYAFLIYGLLELLQSQWHNDLYAWTLELADKLLIDFEDTQFGGFFFTSHHHEELIQRLKSFSDDAMPSGNAIAALSLNRLGYLSGRQQYIDAAEKCLKSACSTTNQSAVSHCGLLNAYIEFQNPPDILFIRSNKKAAPENNWDYLIKQYYLPTTLIYNVPTDDSSANDGLHESLSSKKAESTDIAYPCSGMHCQTPIKNITELQNYLRNNSYRVLE